MPFDGFISYSHAADGRLAPAVQRGLHRLARPWHRRRALWIFRDQTGLAVTPGLWSSIQTAMDGSQYFVLLASPEAARSPWVNKEIEHWVATKSPQRILPVLTDGEWRWDSAIGDFTGDSTAVPEALRGVFVEEPLYLDLRWARDDLHLTLRHARFRDSIAQLAAPMHGVSKDELESEDVRQHRRARRLWSAATAMVLVLALVASLTGVLAMRNAGRANASAVEARRQQQIAFEQRGSAERATEESLRQQENAQTQEQRAQTAAEETRRQGVLAGEQRALADQAAADAALQKGNAEQQQEYARREKENAQRSAEDARREQEDARRSAEDARREKENARRQQEDARRYAEDAQRQKENAQQQEENAQRSAEDAQRSAEEAKRQQELADQAEGRARQQEQLAQQYQEQAQLAIEERQRQEKIAREQEQLAREAAEEARRQREEAALQRRIAINQRLIDRARAMIEYDPQKALMLGVAAQRLHAGALSGDQLSHLVMSTHYAGALADVVEVAVVANGVLAAAGPDGTVALWDISRPARVVRLAAVPTGGSAGKTLVASPDGRTLAVFEGLSPVVLWDVSDPARPARLTELADAAGTVAVAFSPDGRTVATSNRDKSTTLWDVVRGRAPAVLSTLPGTRSLTFGPDGKIAVTSGATATVWNLADRTAPVQLTTISKALADGAVVFSPKLPVVVIEEIDGYVVPWDMRNPALPKRGSSLEAATGDAALSRLAFSADGLMLALSDSSGTTRLRNLSLGAIAGQTSLIGRVATLTGRDGPIRSAALSADGKMLITSGERRTATLWNTRGAFGRETIAALVRPDPADVVGVAFGPDGRSVIAADAPGTTVTWDLTDPAKPVQGAAVQLNSGRIQLMDQSRDGHTLAVGGMDEVVTLIDISRPAEPAVLTRITDPGDVSTFTFSPDGSVLAVGRTNGRTSLYDMANPARPAPLAELTDRGFLNGLSFSGDGRTLAVAAGYNVSLWDLTDRSAPVRHTELSLGASTLAVALSPDGRTLAAGVGWGGSASLWDIADPARPHRLATMKDAESVVMWLGFSPDGTVLATGGISEAHLWEVTDRTSPVRFSTLVHNQLRSRDLVFSSDGHTLAAAGSRSVTLWDYSVPKALSADPGTHACTLTGRGLNAEEWAQYVPELPYQATC
ncbi:WD40 repeat protein [Actinoplanes lutulentus]|uniref:WD40 repeat protein n=1 Tax=Actinoplanes lutulentus TaxID=1287878 RepID=A0A327ZAD2_9ACTN|nr:TIR domain-containing protein [Actinoplanes lutulentus]MBB2946639.1 WD40 repeat protein [Actinoplanes lutulentus]RAK35533.1 WD40 repeat protein [Actinoplanes lutulentus]